MTRFLRWLKNTTWLDRLAFIFVVVVLFLLYQQLGRDALFNWDEGIYAELGRELLLTRDFLSSHWNGSLWLEKPPGIAWVTALGLALFGPTEFAARFFMPIFSVLTLIFVYLLGKRLKNSAMGLSAMALLAYFDLFLGRARAVNTDGMLLTAISVTVYATLVGANPIIIGLLVALSIWFKGLAGLLALTLALPLFFHKPLKYFLYSVLYSLLFTLPWHLYQLVVHGQEFIRPYLTEQVLRRVTTPIEFHIESRWFYFTYLYENLQIGILTLLAIGLFLLLYRFYRTRGRASEIVLVWWLALPLSLFTLAKTRLFWYILPVYPAIALILAYLLVSLAGKKRDRFILGVVILGMCVQSLWKITQSVEIGKTMAVIPDAVQVAKSLSIREGDNLAVLVPASERIAEAILPESQRLSSSFRYGGAPNLVFYSQKHVLYYYNLDLFRADLVAGRADLVIVAASDIAELPPGFQVIVTTKDYLGLARGTNYALR